MARYAIVQNADGLVLNVVEWDGTASFDPGPDNSMIVVPEGTPCQPGMTYQDSSFVAGPAPILSKLLFHATSTLVAKKNDILTVSPTWEELGVVTTTPEFFYAKLSQIIGRCVGSVKSTGNGVELQVVEEKDDGTRTVMNATPFSPAVDASFKAFGFTTNVAPSSGQNRYIFEGRLKDASATGSVKGVSLSLMSLSAQ